MKKILCLILFLAGCATELTPEGRMVRQIDPDWATKCKFLGVIEEKEESGWSIADNRLGAMNKIRNRVAKVGGNAFAPTIISRIGGNGTIIQADAYKCP